VNDVQRVERGQLVIRSRRVVLPDGERPASVHVLDGVIARVGEYRDDPPEGTEQVDAGDLVISPGLVDTHVHVNEPGRTDWEGFDTATRAAAAGGVTTIVDMPLNSIPATIDVAALEAKRAAARRHCHVDVGFWGGVVPGNAGELEALVEAGVPGFKCFLTPSGVEEFEFVREPDLRQALMVLAAAGSRASVRHANAAAVLRLPVLLVHAELPELLRAPAGDPRAYATYLATRPAAAELDAVRLLTALAAEYGVPIHIVHVSSAEAVAAVADARAAGLPVTAETCPHYLAFSAEEVPDGATALKCAPPIRVASHRDALWTGLREQTCSMIVTDHSPAPPPLKCPETGDFLAAWGGIASLELSLAVVWTEAARRGFGTLDLTRWMSTAPAALCGLQARKGAIRPGCDADLVLWDPADRFCVDAERLQQRHKTTPYAGRQLRGRIHSTYLRGVCVWDAGRLAHANHGRLL
jgi:allantoinase